MNMDGTKLPFGARMSTFWYSARLVNRLIPAFFPAMLAEATLRAAQPLVTLFFSARVISELAGGRDMKTLILYASLTVGLAFALAAGRAVAEQQRETMAGWMQVAERVRLLQAERFSSMDFAYTEDTRISEALARMDTLARGSGMGLINFCVQAGAAAEHCFTLCLALPLLAGLNAGGGGWGGAGLLFLVMTVGTLALQRTWERKGAAIVTANEKANTAAQFYSQYIRPDQGAKDIRLYNQAPALLGLFRESFPADVWLGFFRFGGHVGGFTAATLSLIGGVFYLLVGGAALGGTVAAGGVVQSVGAATALAGAAGSLIVTLGEMHNNIPYLQPLRDFLELPDLLEKGRSPVPARENTGYEIEFKNVSFRYPGAEGYALKNLNLKLAAGKRLAVVGRNGSGKTTMIKLLCRLYDPTEGEILLDGVNIREYDHAQYTALFSVVFQDYTLFPLGLGQNVAAAERYDAARAADCLTRAGFGQRLATMPHGLDTSLYKGFDEDGVQVSGGEAQKIALARALYKDAPVVVLDEPTAALDPLAEYEVYTTFNRTIGEKTAVFISHRLSSCRFADEIAVFDAGEMVQHGGHETLVSDRAGKYYELWNAQAGYYIEAQA